MGDNTTGKPYYGYMPMMALLGGVALIGTFINIWLYCDDIKNRGGVLNKVHGAESVTEIIKNMGDSDQPKAPEYVELGIPTTIDHSYDPSDPVESPHSGAQLTPRN